MPENAGTTDDDDNDEAEARARTADATYVCAAAATAGLLKQHGNAIETSTAAVLAALDTPNHAIIGDTESQPPSNLSSERKAKGRKGAVFRPHLRGNELPKSFNNSPPKS